MIIVYNYKDSNAPFLLAEIQDDKISDFAASESGVNLYQDISYSGIKNQKFTTINCHEIPITDIVLYTHWPYKTKRFWELLERK
jgi:hypothetical protein